MSSFVPIRDPVSPSSRTTYESRSSSTLRSSGIDSRLSSVSPYIPNPSPNNSDKTMDEYKERVDVLTPTQRDLRIVISGFGDLNCFSDVEDEEKETPINDYKLNPRSVVASACENSSLFLLVKELGSIDSLQRGTYVLEVNGERMGIFKPSHEVRGGRDSVSFGERVSSRNMNLDFELGIAKNGVDPEAEIPNEIISKVLHPWLTQSVFPAYFEKKEGVFISFIPDAKGFNQLSNEEQDRVVRSMKLNDLQRMAILDLSLHNTDRHKGNFLSSQKKRGEFYPFDHALILPRHFASPATLCWIEWNRTREPFTLDSQKLIEELDFEADRNKILDIYPSYPEENLEVMEYSYHLIKKGMEKGLTPFEIGLFLVPYREFFGSSSYSPMREIYDLSGGDRKRFLATIEKALDWVASRHFMTDYGWKSNDELKELIGTELREFIGSKDQRS